MNTHTPGKWYVKGMKVEGNDYIIANIQETFDYGETKANAQLIASAPELLMALKDLQSAVHEHHLLDIKNRFSLSVADAQADKAIFNAEKEAQ